MPSNDEISRSLFNAIHVNDFPGFEDIVNRYGLAYCEAWSGGYSLLCDAFKWKRDKMCEFLLSKGAKVNSENYEAGMTPLHFAATRQGSEKIFEMLINNHASVDAVNEFKETPLHIAALVGNSNNVRLLLNAGAECSPLNHWGCEPLLNACQLGNDEIVKLILQSRKQKVPSLDPLHFGLALASLRGNEEIFLSLLNAGANPNAVIKAESESSHFGIPEYEGRVPLLLACKIGNVAVVKLLLKHGAALNCSRKKDNFKPLHFASECPGSEGAEVVSHLLSIGIDPNLEADNNITPLHLAATKSKEVLEVLLRNGANADARTNKGMTPLLYVLATKYGSSECAEVLLERGADVNAKDSDGKSPLFYAVNNRSLSQVNLLLKYNPEIDEKTKESIIKAISYDYDFERLADVLMDYNCCFSHEDVHKNPTLLPDAVQKGYKKVVESLLTHSVDGGYVVQYPSLLQVAVERGHAAIIEPLLKSGYDINSKDEMGKMPIHYLMSGWTNKKSILIEIFQILLAHGAVVENASQLLHEAVNKKCFEICRILIEDYNADTNALNEEGKTPLQILVSNNGNPHQNQIEIDEAIQIAKLLLSHGAEVHSVTPQGHSVLFLAAQFGREDIVRLLLQFGANVNERAKCGYTCGFSFTSIFSNTTSNYKPVTNGPTALHTAALNGHDEVVRILLEFDAHIDIQEGDGNETALHAAVSADNEKVVTVLLENGCDFNIENTQGETAVDVAHELFGDEYYSSDEGDPDWIEDEMNPDDDSTSKTLKMHAIKSKLAGLYVSEKVLQHIKILNSVLSPFQEECKNEINALKGVKLCCHLTLYDILKDLKNPAFMKNTFLSQKLCSLNFNNYPIYGSLIKNSVEKNRRKTALLISGKESLDILMKTKTALDGKKSPTLFDDACEVIFSYLSNRELENLILAGKSIKNQVCK